MQGELDLAEDEGSRLMIVCSRCHFENPVHHRYCQECGALLVPGMPSDPVAEDTSAEHTSKNLEAVRLNSLDHGAEDYRSESHRAEDVVENEERSPQDNGVHLMADQDLSTKILAILAHVPDWLKPSHQNSPPIAPSGPIFG